jgi:erythritol transport system substrate-binding protein
MAKNAKIPSFLTDRDISTPKIAARQIISNNCSGAQVSAQKFAQKFIELMGESWSCVELVGRDGDTNAGIRSKGFHHVIDDYPDLRMVARQSANWSRARPF